MINQAAEGETLEDGDRLSGCDRTSNETLSHLRRHIQQDFLDVLEEVFPVLNTTIDDIPPLIDAVKEVTINRGDSDGGNRTFDLVTGILIDVLDIYTTNDTLDPSVGGGVLTIISNLLTPVDD